MQRFSNIATWYKASLRFRYQNIQDIFNLLAITEDIGLYKTHNKEIGCQFFRYCQGLSPLENTIN